MTIESDPRKLEPFYSFWVNELTEQNIIEKSDIAIELAKLSKIIHNLITPTDAYTLLRYQKEANELLGKLK